MATPTMSPRCRHRRRGPFAAWGLALVIAAPVLWFPAVQAKPPKERPGRTIHLSDPSRPWFRRYSRLPYEDIIPEFAYVADPTMKVGSGALGLSARPPGIAINVGIPGVTRGFRRDEAMLKLGDLYFRSPRASAEVLYSDNARQTEFDQESGTIGITTLDLMSMLYLGETLRFGLDGRLIYLPTKGEIGFDGFGISDTLGLETDQENVAFRAYLNLDWLLGGWDMELSDVYSVYDIGDLDTHTFETLELLENQHFDEVDRVGAYRFPNGGLSADLSETRPDDLEARLTTRDTVLGNTVTLHANRMLPSVTRAALRAFRTDLSFKRDRPGRPEWRHGLSAALISERENLRFKPYGIYTVTIDELDEDWRHVARAGLWGPLSEYSDIVTEVGYTWANSETDAMLWRLRLRNVLNEMTWHQLVWGRSVTDPDEELVTNLGYLLSTEMFRAVRLQLTANRYRFERGKGPAVERDEDALGLRLSFLAGVKTTFRLTGLYTETTSLRRGSDGFDIDESTGVFEVFHQLTPEVVLRLLYQRQDRNSSLAGDSYVENLGDLRATVKF